MPPQLATFKIPSIDNEPLKSYAPGSAERLALQEALTSLTQQLPFEIPCIVDGKEIKTSSTAKQLLPYDHANHLCVYHEADEGTIDLAIKGALKAKKEWEEMPWPDRAAIFLKAADLVSKKYRYKIIAATMLGQGKNVWQAEIDAAAELTDFFRFGVRYVEELYAQQPPKNSDGVWNRMEYRPLEGFILAITPFNFTAIGGNLPGTPALVGNTVIWKPSPMAIYSNYLVYQILTEAGLPPGVIQFVPGPAEQIAKRCIRDREFGGLHFTGSTLVFKSLWKDIVANLDVYRTFPRIVGETGGKNFHVVHQSADVGNAVMQSVRAAFEYQGQKCSALSRLYVSASIWKGGFKEQFLTEVSKIKVGSPLDWQNFVGPVIAKHAYDRILGYIQKAKDAGAEILVGGTGDNSKGYYVQPTVILTKDPKMVTMVEEIFGPVVTVYVFEDDKYEETLHLVDETTSYALTGSIFASTRPALTLASKILLHTAGNFYINEKCTGAVVGQQPFGGGRASGTNDKAGSVGIFWRFVSVRSVKENLMGAEVTQAGWGYASNLE